MGLFRCSAIPPFCRSANRLHERAGEASHRNHALRHLLAGEAFIEIAAVFDLASFCQNAGGPDPYAALNFDAEMEARQPLPAPGAIVAILIRAI